MTLLRGTYNSSAYHRSMQVAEECTVKRLGSMQDNGRKQLPGQAPGNGGSGQGSADSAMPQSWVAMRSDEGEAMHRLRHDEGTHVSLSGANCSPLRPHATMLRSHDATPYSPLGGKEAVVFTMH